MFSSTQMLVAVSFVALIADDIDLNQHGMLSIGTKPSPSFLTFLGLE